jgi:hypothetical protein
MEKRTRFTSQDKEGGTLTLWILDLRQTTVSGVGWLQVTSGAEALIALRKVLFVRVRCWIQRVLGSTHDQISYNFGLSRLGKGITDVKFRCFDSQRRRHWLLHLLALLATRICS